MSACLPFIVCSITISLTVDDELSAVTKSSTINAPSFSWASPSAWLRLLSITLSSVIGLTVTLGSTRSAGKALGASSCAIGSSLVVASSSETGSSISALR